MDKNLRDGASRLSKFLDARGANAPVPPADVLARTITYADVQAYPDYFILGPGQAVASTTDCGHGYNLTDGCPNCGTDD
ncbi:hypothetical protein [Amycolatopsis sp. DSM 110486]|uniref:hypothetical protein n=1 Tax=Amycolatopsis sp. DSM 110486 TaxID=2865832 RepID=UPI001C69C790|nr:hypothetical protein [Amycolatopsis sp. DSM 110486]QYN17498.1 hypothetical protein K1T34_32450 [Amycolatopsis sp. DSM 110486]